MSDFGPPTYESGEYNVHVYMNGGGFTNVFCLAMTTQRPLPPAPPQCSSVTASWYWGSRLRVDIAGVVNNATAVNVAVWSAIGGQDDLVWQGAANIDNGDWISTFSPPTTTLGDYIVHVYMNNSTYQNPYYTNVWCGSAVASRPSLQAPPASCP